MCKVTLHLCFIIWADPLANVEYLGKKKKDFGGYRVDVWNGIVNLNSKRRLKCRYNL